MGQTADSAKLRKLTRAQIQSLAKREGIRANGKTEDIIHRLIEKYPAGVPSPEDANNPSASLAPSKPDPHHETTHIVDSAQLRGLPRTQLQSLAKRDGLRSVGKTAEIIRRLLRKHPRGVPVTEDVLPSPDTQAKPNLRVAKIPRVSPATPKRIKLRIPRKNIPALPPVPRTPKVLSNAKGKGKETVEAASPTLSNEQEELDLLYPYDEPEAGPSNLQPSLLPEVVGPRVLPESPTLPCGEPLLTPPPERSSRNGDNDQHTNTQRRSVSPAASVAGWRADEEDEPEEVYDDVDYPKGAPNHYMVVDALRQFTTLVNTIPSMETRIAESRCLLQRAEAMLDKAIPDARELVVTREYLETFLLGKMKQKRELWDGTAKMTKQDRKLRTEWLRSARKANAEKRWREASELYKKHGLEPESLSAFLSESEEEVAASLQTTPTSSRDGSSESKRSREDSVDGESDEDASSDRERRRKRARRL